MSNFLTKSIFLALTCLLIIVISGCSGSKIVNISSMDYNSFPRKIQIPQPSKGQIEKYNPGIKGYKKDLTKASGKVISGYTSGNREFLEDVIKPLIFPHIEELRNMPRYEMINTLALFGHELFQIYFGKDFYRWGGDILDLDDPQSEGYRFDCRYGLDCSGFSTLPYELAVYFGLLKAEDMSAVFSSRGFEIYCKKGNMEDKGGLDGEGNNFRVDTRELAALGKEIFRVEKSGSPTDAQVKMLQAGDLVGRDGHFGMIVEINHEPYYLESGGWVLPNTGGNPYQAKEALTMFAKNGGIFIRRALPDKYSAIQ